MADDLIIRGDDGKETTLSVKHHADLGPDGSGLSDSQIVACGFKTTRDHVKIAKNLNWRGTTDHFGPCLAFPYYGPAGDYLGFVRYKPDVPPTFNGKPAKYLSPSGSGLHIYLPPGTRGVLQDANTPLWLVEGEKKAARLDQERMRCIGLMGVSSWSASRPKDGSGKPIGPRVLMPQLKAVCWARRRVFILFDSDAAHKPAVRDEAHRLGCALVREGADVRVSFVPPR